MPNQSKHFKKHSSDFRLKVVLKYLSEKFTIPEICIEFGISKATLHNWVTQFKANRGAVFNGNKTQDKNKERQQKEIINLYTKIGELTVERDFLKKVFECLSSDLRRKNLDKNHHILSIRKTMRTSTNSALRPLLPESFAKLGS